MTRLIHNMYCDYNTFRDEILYYTGILGLIEIGDWELWLRQDTDGGRYFLQIQFDAPDNDNPDIVERQYCRKWYLSPYMTRTELVRTAHLAYHQAVLHEADETFKYRGVTIYSPHNDLENLAENPPVIDIRS